MGIGATAGAAAVGGIALTAQASSDTSAKASGTLAFDKDAYTEKTITITDAEGTDHEVVYHFWKPITYVTNPVDTDHQSLVVSVPVKIDGTTVDATDAPIIFANAVGGYFPATVKSATGVDEAEMEMGGAGLPAGSAPSGAPSTGAGDDGSANDMNGAMGEKVSLPKLGLAAGYVVVEPGCRGRTLTNSDGEYYGTAPAAIVDLKAAVRHVRANKGRIPGNTDRIVSTGTSAGGALSSLLGASGDSKIYDKYLKELGAADASDAVFATGAWCPITDLEHADGAYEYCWGSNVTQSTGKTVDQAVVKELQSQFAEYQASLKLKGLKGFGALTGRNYDQYLLDAYMQPAATTYLKSLSDADRTTYLAKNTFITWKNDQATFDWAGYAAHVGGRKKTAPAFDAFDLSAGENNEFGLGTTESRHFTAYSADNDTSGLSTKRVASDIPGKLDLMNPMHHIGMKNPGRSRHWWLRVGTNDTDSSPVIVSNLAASLDNIGDDVNSLMYWDQGHGANTDAGDFIAWVTRVTGAKRQSAK
ncbi:MULTISPECIES: subtype B tannase [unclassified Streptomyces]|uniref:subtype B tannase n=1 Tax=unclassified Streptomyces TaxID=2593676 RepID=UPI002476C635|nr:subtype B tannase [Streptomyces sp. SAI-133]